ncbi:MAG: ACT domain-containing protein [Eubacteriales bacterium]
MAIKQLSVFAENKPGSLIDITRLLGDAGIDIRALSIADSQDYGIIRLIVSDTEQARALLSDRRYLVRVNEVLGAAMPDRPGALSGMLTALHSRGINIEYMYAFIASERGHAYVVLRVQDHEAAAAVLKENGIRLIGGV